LSTASYRKENTGPKYSFYPNYSGAPLAKPVEVKEPKPMPRYIKTEEVKQARKQRLGQTNNLLQQILNDINQIKQEITSIKQEITSIKKRITTIENRVFQ
jgi:septal ring factor EnvC (AmiA/AmiB activator)